MLSFFNAIYSCFLVVPHYSVVFNDIFESITVELQMDKSRNIIISCSYQAPGSSIQCCSDFIEKLLILQLINPYTLLVIQI